MYGVYVSCPSRITGRWAYTEKLVVTAWRLRSREDDSRMTTTIRRRASIYTKNETWTVVGGETNKNHTKEIKSPLTTMTRDTTRVRRDTIVDGKRVKTILCVRECVQECVLAVYLVFLWVDLRRKTGGRSDRMMRIQKKNGHTSNNIKTMRCR